MSSSIDFELKHDEDTGKNCGILLFHGLTGSPFEMRKYGNFLYELGFDVYCYSFPGHGDDLDNIQKVTQKDWCDFAQEKYSDLRSQYKDFFVSGLCLGAAISLYLAEHNSDLTGIISLSTTLFLDGFCMPKRKCLLPLALKTIFRYFYTFPEDECLGVKNITTRKSLAKIMSKTTIGMDNYPLSCVYELLELSKIVRKDLKKINTPILIIHSKFDNLTSVKSAKVVYEGISSTNKKYIELEDSYHMVLYDNEKQFVMKSVAEFIHSLLELNTEDINCERVETEKACV